MPVQAEDSNFKTDYNVEYVLNENQTALDSRVKFDIKLTNLKTEYYVNKIALAFPKSFVISNVVARDNKADVVPTVTTDDSRIKIELHFNNPDIGRNTVNSFHLEFDQSNLFKINGNIWEVFLPTIEDKTRTSYNIIVHLPPNSNKKLSIAKPKPDSIHGNDITWVNPTARTIYAVFGNDQYYDVSLQYHLTNPKMTPVFTDVAFPPETEYQRGYVKTINPQPDKVYTDEDGNYIGRYVLKPKQNLTVVYDGTISLFTKPREEVRAWSQNQFEVQKNVLLTQTKYWTVPDPEKYAKLQSPQDLYRYIASTFRYNYGKLNTSTKRMGAAAALAAPDQAVCSEFTDTFVALARERGIYAREIEGYGVSQDTQLRPLSLVSDVLHAWPQYYDTKSGTWLQVDPTWENTSGIDYFNSFDLNHITFAIHGKDDSYPLPAGMYKTENTKDIMVRPASTIPSEVTNVSIVPFNLPPEITDRETYKTKLIVVNSSNVYLYNVPIQVKADHIQSSVTNYSIATLAPFEKKEIPLELKSAPLNLKQKATVEVSILNQQVYAGSLNIMPFYYKLAFRVSFVILGISLIYLLITGIIRMKLRK
jgi:hypothetical protein